MFTPTPKNHVSNILKPKYNRQEHEPSNYFPLHHSTSQVNKQTNKQTKRTKPNKKPLPTVSFKTEKKKHNETRSVLHKKRNQPEKTNKQTKTYTQTKRTTPTPPVFRFFPFPLSGTLRVSALRGDLHFGRCAPRCVR